ncbi:Asp23/Gls24 family envelope stress response protein [Nocardia sp. NPDC005366]|uniref:Asp23/Gls24 family envelope stress response protein n=1 Tax=Nocardia sp. NPDC005366 TaxID=3156878 RepID=UPI0033A7357E
MTAAAGELPGRTTVSPRVVRRIAARAAREVAGVSGDVAIEAEINGGRTSLDVRLPIGYPQPITRVTEACREHVSRRTAELTGLTVTGVDIVIAELTTETVVGRQIR